MKLEWRHELFALAIFAAMGAIGMHYYPLLPNIMASHFDVHGLPNGWMPKASFFFIMGIVEISIYGLLTFLPRVDPLKKKIEVRFKNILLLRDVFLLFFAVVFSMSLEAAREGVLNVDLLGVALGILFIVMGNYLPKIPQNWFVGIKTPWTISSEIVWKKTHILGGWLFVLSGLTYILCSALKISSALILLAVILVPAVVSMPYSYFLYKKIQRTNVVP